MLKHFGIWPDGVDKNDLLGEQKIFLIYLMGAIPNMDQWSVQVDYEVESKKINSMSPNDIEISKSDIDLAKLQGKEIDEIKQKRLKEAKQKELRKLNKKYGIETDEPKEPEPETADPDINEQMKQRQNVLNMLNGNRPV